MDKKYQVLCDDIAEKLKTNNEVIYKGEDIVELVGKNLPKSYEKNYYLNGSSPIGKCLHENGATAVYMPAKLIIKRK